LNKEIAGFFCTAEKIFFSAVLENQNLKTTYFKEWGCEEKVR
jgi:hypothetical protein